MIKPIIWAIGGTDSGGGAGLAADQRAADSLDAHLCTVVTAVTAQNSLGVSHIHALPLETIDAQLQALERDLPALAIKTGLLGGVQQIQAVARWVDRLRHAGPLALIVDPVLGSSSGASFIEQGTIAAYRELLLPRATLVTPNRGEARALLGLADDDAQDIPALAAALRALGAEGVCITGGDETDGDESSGDESSELALDWMDTSDATGWLALPRVRTANNHGTGCTFATSVAASLAHGFALGDAIVLAKMATAHALHHGYRAGSGAGPVHAKSGFLADATLMPQLSWSARPDFAPFEPRDAAAAPLGLYAITDRAARIADLLRSGVGTVQLRIKHEEGLSADVLGTEIRTAIALCAAAGTPLFINDHQQLARVENAPGVHLGQEDLLRLNDDQRELLRQAEGMDLGISSHSLCELARARSMAPRYIACGPVWPTTTKDMPWLPQGLDRLRWWCRLAGAPVVAIGGILQPEQAAAAAASGADGVCVLRGLGTDPAQTVPVFLQAMAAAIRPPACLDVRIGQLVPR